MSKPKKLLALVLAAASIGTLASCKPGNAGNHSDEGDSSAMKELEAVPFETADNHREQTVAGGYTIDMGDLVQVYFEEHPEWTELYNKSWQLHKDHIQKIPEATNPESPYYVDEAFSGDIFLWDTVFMMLYDRYGMNVFPVLTSMENFYYCQTDSNGSSNGYIPREINEQTGKDYYSAGFRDQNSTNPPLLSWAEWECYQIHGDVSRFDKLINGKTIYTRLCEHFAFIEKNKKTSDGLYGKTGGLGTGLDDSPNQGAGQTYNSLTMQQAQNAYYLAKIAEAMGKTEDAAYYMAQHDRIAKKANELMWDEAESMYSNLTRGGEHTNVSTPTSLWAMVARVATADTAAAMVQNQALNSEKMFRPNGLSTLAYDHAEYAAYGGYWKGGIWAPTSYQYIKGLVAYNYVTEAFEESLRLVNTLSAVYTAGKKGGYVPKATLFENYSAEYIRNGWWKTDCELTRQDFAGWTPCMSIGLILENLAGVTVSAPSATVTWNVNLTEHFSVSNLYFVHDGVTNRVSLAAAERTLATDPLRFSVKAEQPFTLTVTAAGLTKSYEIPAGESTFLHGEESDAVGTPTLSVTAVPIAESDACFDGAALESALDYVLCTEEEDAAVKDGMPFVTGKKAGILYNVNTVGNYYGKGGALRKTAVAFGEAKTMLEKPYNRMGNEGFMLCAEASTSQRLLTLLVRVSDGGQGVLTATLSDASVPAVSQTLTAGEYVIRLPYAAASEGRYLLLKWTLDNAAVEKSGSTASATVGFAGAAVCQIQAQE